MATGCEDLAVLAGVLGAAWEVLGGLEIQSNLL